MANIFGHYTTLQESRPGLLQPRVLSKEMKREVEADYRLVEAQQVNNGKYLSNGDDGGS